MALDDFLTRLCAAGPLLFLGLMVALDPGGMITSINSLARGLRALDYRRQGFRWPAGPELVSVPETVRTLMRGVGIALSVFAFLALAGIVN